LTEKPARISVLIADDYAIVRTGVRLILEGESDIEVAGEARNGREALELARRLEPNVILMDISMPELSGIDATREVTSSMPQTRVLGLTMHEDDRYFFELLQAGASGYVVKGASPEELLSVIRAVARGQAYIHPSLAGRLLDDYLHRVTTGEERDSYGGLTEREREVLRHIGEGNTSREIAEILVLSINTIERHRANIMEKLNLHSKTELVKYAIRNGIAKL
jgi:DNA-binding NarL/FixJ family response regulator